MYELHKRIAISSKREHNRPSKYEAGRTGRATGPGGAGAARAGPGTGTPAVTAAGGSGVNQTGQRSRRSQWTRWAGPAWHGRQICLAFSNMACSNNIRPTGVAIKSVLFFPNPVSYILNSFYYGPLFASNYIFISFQQYLNVFQHFRVVQNLIVYNYY